MTSYLQEAGERLEQGEWCKFYMTHYTQPDTHCALGWYDEVARSKPQPQAAVEMRLGTFSYHPFIRHEEDMRVLSEVLNELYPGRTHDMFEGNRCMEHGWVMTPANIIATVNNHPATTKQEVVVAFKEAARRRELTPA